MTVIVTDKSGKPVLGKDKSQTTLTFQLGVVEEAAKPAGHEQKMAINAEMELVRSNPQKAAEELARLKRGTVLNA